MLRDVAFPSSALGWLPGAGYSANVADPANGALPRGVWGHVGGPMGRVTVPTAPVLTPREAARLLRVTPATLLRSPAPYFTLGAGRKRPRRLYLRESLLVWAKLREVAT